MKHRWNFLQQSINLYTQYVNSICISDYQAVLFRTTHKLQGNMSYHYVWEKYTHNRHQEFPKN